MPTVVKVSLWHISRMLSQWQPKHSKGARLFFLLNPNKEFYLPIFFDNPSTTNWSLELIFWFENEKG